MSIKFRLPNYSIAAGAAIFLLLAADASASEGVIEINQAAALAGGIRPGDAPGFPVTLNQPGSYRLTGDLVFSANQEFFIVTGIIITAEDVSLDLGGFSVSVGNTNPDFSSAFANPISIESDNVYIHDGVLRVIAGFHLAQHIGQFGAYERIHFANAKGSIGQPHGSFRKCSSSDYLDFLVSGLAIGNEGEIFSTSGLVVDHVDRNGNVTAYGGSVLVVGSQMNQLGTQTNGYVAYGRNVITGGLTGSGIGNAFEIGTNVCGTDTSCP